ncbi:unnamed protein product [Ilex paraguariensis]|uniref:Golgin candidate 2 n=1 Tax=Ilex paraguariensis TaxID=185542 RepID=A0ABC8R4C4_9AQUA
MANWISAKLKAAETILQQIDQQAAESLRKNEKARSDDLNLETPTKSSETVPLKDQLKKKTLENNDLIGKLRSDQNNFNNDRDGDKEVEKSVNLNPKSSNSLTDGDWTELLGAPNKNTNLGVNSRNGVAGIRGIKREARREGSLGLKLSALEGRRSQKGQTSVVKGLKKLDVRLEGKVNGGELNGRGSDGGDSRVSVSSVELWSDGESLDKREFSWKDGSGSVVVEHHSAAIKERNGLLDAPGDGEGVHSNENSVDGVSLSTDRNHPAVTMAAAVDGMADLKLGMNNDGNQLRTAVVGVDEPNLDLRNSGSEKKGSSLANESESDSDTDTASTSDSESDHEREEMKRRRQQILAAKAAAKALAAIKERENMVARLEGEKQSLEKIIEERAKQQAQEASELQTTMMEIMDAVDIEKQKHNTTRMEALSRLAKLETANADLARSLASAQWNLEVEVNLVAKLRQQVEQKEASHEELRRRISSTHQTASNLVVSKGVKIERDVLEAEYSFVADKLGRLQEKVTYLPPPSENCMVFDMTSHILYSYNTFMLHHLPCCSKCFHTMFKEIT